MEGLRQEQAMLRKSKIAQALAGDKFVESMRLCRFQPEDWKVAVHIIPGESALKMTVAHLAELCDGNVNIYNPQLVNMGTRETELTAA